MTYLTETFIPYTKVLTPLLLEGLWITIYVSALAFLLSIILGAILAIIQHFRVKILSQLAKVYVSYFRGTPLLIQLFLFYYGLPMVFDVMKRCPKTFALVLCLGLNSAAYISESIRGAIESVDKGQYEASIAFGLTHPQMMLKIILPQAAVAAIPPIVNSCLDIIKMSSLGMTIGIQDIMGEAQLTAATYYKTFETYILAAVFYWILAIVLGVVQKKVEKIISSAYQKHMLEIKNLSKSFGNQQVLDHISLKIEKGKVIAVIGPSGTGKSTLLRCINVLERPEEGTIQLDDQIFDYEKLSKADIQVLRTRTSMVFQNSNLYRNKTALENITTPLTLVKKMPKEEADKIALDLLEKVGVLEKKDAYPETLSGGEKQRVGIARALAVNPDIILFDEPTSALDPELVAGVLDVIKDLAKQHTTMLIVTHEMKFAKNVADEVVFMEGGHIVEMGLAHEVFENPKEERTRQFLSKNNE